MIVFEVISDQHFSTFLEVPSSLHSSDPNWTIQLGVDIEVIFDPSKNSLLKNGVANRWVLLDDFNMPVGRIAAFYNKDGDPTKGGFGFFECNDNNDNANALITTAENWLRSEGCKTIEGPINFGEKDRFWGLLTYGFNTPTIYLDNHNPDYYEGFFASNKYSKKDTILTHSFLLEDTPFEVSEKIAERLLQKNKYSFRPFDLNNIDEQAKDLSKVYQKGFDETTRMKHLTHQDIKELILQNKSALEEKAFWMAYHDEEPIGVSLYMKDMNQKIRSMGNRKNDDRINLKGIAFAVIPGYRNQGIEIALSHFLLKELINSGESYKINFCGINEKSTKITSFFERIGTKLEKVHKTFTKTL